jgi:ABC-2 type transport system permease protein
MQATRTRHETPRPNQLRALWALTIYPLRAMMRNPSTVAFGFMFPVAFILVFGLIGGGTTGIRLGVPAGQASGPLFTSLQQSPGLNVVIEERAELERELRLGKIDAMAEIGADRVTVVLNSANPQGGMAVPAVEQTVSALNLQAAGITSPHYQLQVSEVAGRRNRYIDFALPGQIGMALVSTAIFGTVFGLIYLKKALILKRLFATPVQAMTILLGQGLARLVLAIAQAVVILAIGVFAFGFQLANGWVTFVAILALSAVALMAFLGVGLFIAGMTNDENAAGPLTNLATLPQFLLSGVFFSTDVFPNWLRIIAEALPLTHLNAAMRAMAAEGAGFVEVLPNVLVILAWGAASYIAAARTFKWE